MNLSEIKGETIAQQNRRLLAVEKANIWNNYADSDTVAKAVENVLTSPDTETAKEDISDLAKVIRLEANRQPSYGVSTDKMVELIEGYAKSY